MCGNPGRGAAARLISSKPKVAPEAGHLGDERVAPEVTNWDTGIGSASLWPEKDGAWAARPSPELQPRWRGFRTQSHVDALVKHRNGWVVASTSTRVRAIKQHLRSERHKCSGL